MEKLVKDKDEEIAQLKAALEEAKKKKCL